MGRRALLIFLCCFIATSVDALHVKIFKDYRFKGLIYDVTYDILEENKLECHNVKDYARGTAGSLETDTCLILYEGLNCAGNSFKLSRDMTDQLEALGRDISSFHPCTKDFGGDTIRVDMMDSSSKIIAKYFDICGCQDIPSQIQPNLAKIQNYGNCITVYSTATCSGNDTEIPAGQSGLSQNLPELGYYVRSVSGCGPRRQCVKLHSEIFKFELLPDASRLSLANEPKEVALATKTTFWNNGSATVFQEYEAIERVRQSTTIEKSRSFYAFASVKTDASMNGSVNADYDTNTTLGKVSGQASAYLNYAYYAEGESMNTEDEIYTYEEEKEFKVRQVIEIPACAKYDVSSTVEVVENYPIIYEMYVRVTGDSGGGNRLTGEELAGMVDELTFVEVLDEFTAVFKTAERMEASVGVTTRISGEGTRIPGCQQ